MPKKNNKIFQASLWITLSGILYGFLGFFGTTVLREHIPITTMLFWRFLIAGSSIFFFVFGKRTTTQWVLDTRTLISMFILGAIGYAGSSEFYFIASQYTGTGLAMVIFFSYPIMVALSSWLIHRKQLSLGTLITLIAMMIGLFLLRDSATHSISIIGVFFGVLAAICYAFYVMGSKSVTTYTGDSNVLTAIVCLGCAFIFFIFSLSFNQFVFPHSLKSWLYLFALGILATALPIQLMLEGLKYISSMRASIISVVEPLVTIFVGVILLHESISHSQWIGAIVILLSALLVQFQREL